MITRLFKLDKPLGRAGLFLAVIILLFLSIATDTLLKSFKPMFSLISLAYFVLLVPLGVRRLLDIGKNQFLAFLLMIPFLQFVFVIAGGAIGSVLRSVLGVGPGLKTLVVVLFMFLNILSLVSAGLFLYLLFKEGRLAQEEYARNARRATIDKLIIGALVFAFFSLLIGSCQYDIYRSKQAAMQLVGALEKFKQDKGHYPKNEEELIPDYLPDIPKTEQGFFVRTDLLYHRYDEKEPYYCVSFIYMPIRHVSYCSSSRVWRDWD